MRIRHLLFTFLFCPLFLIASSTKLTTYDVKKVMDQLFEYHIEQKEMSPLIIERSFKVYLNQFDPYFAYLFQNEVDGYLKPSESLLKGALANYEKERFDHFFLLNENIEKGILRARNWRREWELNPKQLIETAKNWKNKTLDHKAFAKNLNECKDRHYEMLVLLVKLHLNEAKGSFTDYKERRLIQLCEKQLVAIENKYLGLSEEGKPLPSQEKEHLVILRMLKAFAHSLDAHTAYYSPEEAYAMKVQLEKGMSGIGVVLHEGIEGIEISEVVKGGPAEKAGLLNGDTIVEVDGKEVRDFSFHKVLEILRGKEGTQANIGVLKKDNQEFVRVSVTREKIIIDDKRVSVSKEPFGDGFIGKITLYSFYEGDDGISSEKDLRKAIEALKEEGPLYGLVLDLRDNSGGFLSQAVHVSGLFISGGVVVISKYSDGSMKYYRALDGRRFYEGPLVVLVSKGSASATEIVAQALQDYGVAVVVGDHQTYGKGTIQHQTVTNDKSDAFFKVTIGKYYTVSGRSTQIDGVKADIVVSTESDFEEMGEGYLDYPLPKDNVAPAYLDTLADIDTYARKWFTKYYVPAIQAKLDTWTELLPTLVSNSERRVSENKNYQAFLKKVRDKEEAPHFGENDLQMEESINIVKDMILLQK